MFSLSVKEIKKILQIEDTRHDEYIEIMLPIIIALVEKYCNDVFAMRDDSSFYKKDEDGYKIIDIGIVICIAKIIEFYMLKSGVTQNTVSRMSFSFSNDLPNSIKSVLNEYRKVRFI